MYSRLPGAKGSGLQRATVTPLGTPAGNQTAHSPTGSRLPTAFAPKSGKRLVIREIGQDRDTPLTDFQGQPTTHAAFAAREKIKLVPVVAFYGPNGRKLAEPIVGARLPDFYQSYLDDAIDQASRQLKTP